MWNRLNAGNPNVADDFARATAEAQRAIQSDPSLADPYAALGAVAFNDGRIAEAEQQFQKTFLLDPTNATAHVWHSILIAWQGRIDAAIDEIEGAIQLDPMAFMLLEHYARELAYPRRYQEALEASDRARALRNDVFIPNHGDRALLLFALGRHDEAAEVAQSGVAFG